MNPYRRFLVPMAAVAALAFASTAWAEIEISDGTISDADETKVVVDAINANMAGIKANKDSLAGLTARTTTAETAIADLEKTVKTFETTEKVTGLTNQVNAINTTVDDVDDRIDVVEAKLGTIASTEDVKTLRAGVDANAAAAQGNAMALKKHNAMLADHDARIDENTAGIAAAMALSSIPDVPAGKTFAIGAGTGFWGGQAAFAVGTSAQYRAVSVKAGLTGNTDGFGVGAGVSVAF